MMSNRLQTVERQGQSMRCVRGPGGDRVQVFPSSTATNPTAFSCEPIAQQSPEAKASSANSSETGRYNRERHLPLYVIGHDFFRYEAKRPPRWDARYKDLESIQTIDSHSAFETFDNECGYA